MEKHMSGDWGDLGEDDKRANDQALVDGSRLLSAYRTLKGVKILVHHRGSGRPGQAGGDNLPYPSRVLNFQII